MVAARVAAAFININVAVQPCPARRAVADIATAVN
jgi:hypothetical protein